MKIGKRIYFSFVKAGVSHDGRDNGNNALFLKRWFWGYWFPRLRIRLPRGEFIPGLDIHWIIYSWSLNIWPKRLKPATAEDYELGG